MKKIIQITIGVLLIVSVCVVANSSQPVDRSKSDSDRSNSELSTHESNVESPGHADPDTPVLLDSILNNRSKTHSPEEYENQEQTMIDSMFESDTPLPDSDDFIENEIGKMVEVNETVE